VEDSPDKTARIPHSKLETTLNSKITTSGVKPKVYDKSTPTVK